MTAGGALVLLAAAIQAALAVAAIAGTEGLAANVREIEERADFGELYFSLATWGWIALVAATLELAAGVAIARRTPNARLAGLIAAYLGLAVAFFTLAIFRWAAVALVVILLAAIFVLSYLAARKGRSRPGA